MLTIPYDASDFGPHWGAGLSKGGNLNVSWHDLVWAATSMGKPGAAFLFSHGWHSVSDVIVRIHSLYANLVQSSNYVSRSVLYDSLDPTEKGGVSYFLGMLAAKIVGDRLLNVPWLFHLSMLSSMGGYATLKSRSQPDLIGLLPSGDWVVAEAKGRTFGFSSSSMKVAKSQTRQVRKINGRFPCLRVAVQSYFAPHLHWAIQDPEEFDPEAIDMECEVHSMIGRYYSAVMAATQLGAVRREIRGRAFQARELPEIGVTLAIDEEVKRLVVEQISPAELRASTLREVTKVDNEEGFRVFSDGIAIGLDNRWSEVRMQEDPRSRQNG